MSRKRHPREIDPPYRDPLFMESLPARPVRIMTEYIDPLERLRREKVGDTIVMFGSARIRSRRAGPGAHCRNFGKKNGATPRWNTGRPCATRKPPSRCPATTRRRANCRGGLRPGRCRSATIRGAS